jgi:rhodanese-related sulfurtransferase
VYISDVAEIGRLVPDTGAPIVLYCNGPFCGKSKRLSEDLLAAGYTKVSRYQLGAPVWRALGGVMQIEPEAISYVWTADQTAVWLDARSPDEFGSRTLHGAHNLSTQNADIQLAKEDGRLPNADHNTRIIVFGSTGIQARALAEEVTNNAFHNVAFFDGSFDDLEVLASP